MADGVVDRLVVAIQYDYDQAGEREVEKGFKTLIGLGAATVAALTAATLEATAAGDAAAKMGREFGLSAEDMSALGFIAERTGAELEVLRPAVASLTRQIEQARQGSESSVLAFRALGLEGAALAGELDDPIRALGLIGDAIEASGRSGETRAAALTLLGESAGRLSSLFAEGSEGIARLRGEADALGATISDADAAAAEDLADSLTDLKTIAVGLSRDIGFGLIPTVDRLAEATVGWYLANQEVIDAGLNVVVEATTGALDAMATPLGAVVTGVGGLATAVGALKAVGAVPTLMGIGKALGVIAIPAAVIATLALAFEDLAVAIDGGDSAIGSLADSIGVGSQFDHAMENLGKMLDAAGVFAGVLWDQFTELASGALEWAKSFEPLREVIEAIEEALSGGLGGLIDMAGDQLSDAAAGFDKAARYLSGDDSVVRETSQVGVISDRAAEVGAGTALYEAAAGSLPREVVSGAGNVSRLSPTINVPVSIGATAEEAAREAARQVEAKVLAGFAAADGGMQ